MCLICKCNIQCKQTRPCRFSLWCFPVLQWCVSAIFVASTKCVEVGKCFCYLSLQLLQMCKSQVFLIYVCPHFFLKYFLIDWDFSVLYCLFCQWNNKKLWNAFFCSHTHTYTHTQKTHYNVSFHSRTLFPVRNWKRVQFRTLVQVKKSDPWSSNQQLHHQEPVSLRTHLLMDRFSVSVHRNTLEPVWCPSNLWNINVDHRRVTSSQTRWMQKQNSFYNFKQNNESLQQSKR